MDDLFQRACSHGQQPSQESADSATPQSISLLHGSDEESSPSEGLVFDMLPLTNGLNVDDQLDSTFFTKLPLEVRCHIYSYVLPAERRLWVRAAKRSSTAHQGHSGAPGRAGHSGDEPEPQRYLQHFPTATVALDTTYPARLGSCCSDTGNSFWKCVSLGRFPVHHDSLSLMRTCKQVYVYNIHLTSIFLFPHIFLNFPPLFSLLPLPDP
ncbi:hypothetical protein QBC33DRAFT_173100 [Phialemonium atrogriseum]|uniref:DUF7730 domain-containing protein n=1 Tax=Phialemonium atrogriseum TaxID=1093897 RepID=A0AAJ0FR76_9PEZI|nr:uncharacterized protein QBC33DRAFT_173100 [Phialemonium atrogriseum]KAK1772018.1 hypothetical protein QBC33DRAFT_173100 [Phialemonium atrogriseum]